MSLSPEQESRYVRLLEKELVPALGCTEPIAIAYAAASAVDLLGRRPDRMRAACSGNIIKNVKGVIVPNSGGMKGIETAAILGALGGDHTRVLETLSTVRPEDIKETQELVRRGDFCQVDLIEGGCNLHIIITVWAGEESALVEIRDSHTNITRKEKNGQVLFEQEESGEQAADQPDLTEGLTVETILEFANTVPLERVEAVIQRQIDYNTAISEEGLHGHYGAMVGRTLLQMYGDSDVRVRARARAAAGSDARMNGCVLPVVINSGSGNQGMTVSLPVIEYARAKNATHEQLVRALLVSNLVSIHQKSQIGRLSAYCGAVSAAAGAGAAITYLEGGSLRAIGDTIVNTLANVSGIVCDGAKASCAAKIASSVDAAILGHCMAMEGEHFEAGDGIVQEDVESTMGNVGRLGRDGMKETDLEILHMMIGK